MATGLTVGFWSPVWPPGTLPSGAVIYLANLVGALREQGTTCFVFTAQSTGEHEDHVRRFPPFRSTDLWGRLKAHLGWRLYGDSWHGKRVARQIRDEIDRLRASSPLDLLEIEDSFGRALWLTRISSVPVVVRLHGPWFGVGLADGVSQDATFKARVRDEGAGIAAASGVTAPSRFVLDQVRDYYGLPLPHAEVIPNPVETVPAEKRWNVAQCERNVILFVGRFDRVKGGDLVVDAFARVVREVPNAKLVFVGPDRGLVDDAGKHWQLGAYLEERLASPDERARVEVLGVRSRSEILELRRRAHVTIVPSRYETFGMTAIEALVTGCPLVVSNAGGLSEAIVDGENALAFRKGDRSDLAARILSLLRDDVLAKRLGAEAARLCRERYQPAQIARKTLDYYRSVLARNCG